MTNMDEKHNSNKVLGEDGVDKTKRSKANYKKQQIIINQFQYEHVSLIIQMLCCAAGCKCGAIVF